VATGLSRLSRRAEWLARERLPTHLPTHLPGLAEQPHWSAGGEQGFNFVTIRQDASQNLLAKVVDYIQAEWAAGQAVILTCYSEGSSQRLGQLLREAGLTNLRPRQPGQTSRSHNCWSWCNGH
jgi:transcription-repair coupling factor (superfamily II helicase)